MYKMDHFINKSLFSMFDDQLKLYITKLFIPVICYVLHRGLLYFALWFIMLCLTVSIMPNSLFNCTKWFVFYIHLLVLLYIILTTIIDLIACLVKVIRPANVGYVRTQLIFIIFVLRGDWINFMIDLTRWSYIRLQLLTYLLT